MNKHEYLAELKGQLKALPSHEVEEILADYREHFEMGQRAGKSEHDISMGLGLPKFVAQEYLVSSLVRDDRNQSSVLTRAKIIFQVMLLLLVLAPFNFLVIVGPFMVLLALTLAGWAIPLSVAGVGIAAIGLFFTMGTVLSLPGLAIIFMLLGTLGLASLGMLLMVVVTKYLTQIIASYLRWNLNFIKARQA